MNSSAYKLLSEEFRNNEALFPNPEVFAKPLLSVGLSPPYARPTSCKRDRTHHPYLHPRRFASALGIDAISG